MLLFVFFTLRLAEIFLTALVWSGSVCGCHKRKERLMNTHFCVCCVYDCSLKDFCVHMHASSQLGAKHCVQEKLACARVYSKLYYFFGSVFLTITKLFCFGENLTRKPVTLLSFCWRSASIIPIAKWRKWVLLWYWLLALVVRIKHCGWINKNGKNKREDWSFQLKKKLFFSS